MRKYFLSTVSYPVMNLVLSLYAQKTAKNTDEYSRFQIEQSTLRYKSIFQDRPYKGIFS